jgi:hypothetical protein
MTLRQGRSRIEFSVSLLVAAAFAVGACAGSVSDPGGGSDPGPGPGPGDDGTPIGPERFPFEALPPNVYAAKVKYLVTGLPLTDPELVSIIGDPSRLPGMVDGWMARPEWRAKLLEFFMQAFQQTQIADIELYNEQFGRDGNDWPADDQNRFLRAAEESFARTVLSLLDEGKPFNEVVTTQRFMMNPPLMAFLAYMDAVPRNDLGRNVTAGMWLLQKYPTLTFTRTANLDPTTLLPTPIPLAETLDPASPNFMKWYDPTPYTGTDTNCADPQTRMGAQALGPVIDIIFGRRRGCAVDAPSASGRRKTGIAGGWSRCARRRPARSERSSGTYRGCATPTPPSWCWRRRGSVS